MSENDVPVSIFSGPHTEALFLKSLLESAGIETNLTGAFFGPPGKLYVWPRDEHKARDLIEDFLEHGRRTGVEPKSGEVIHGNWQNAPKAMKRSAAKKRNPSQRG